MNLKNLSISTVLLIASSSGMHAMQSLLPEEISTYLFEQTAHNIIERSNTDQLAIKELRSLFEQFPDQEKNVEGNISIIRMLFNKFNTMADMWNSDRVNRYAMQLGTHSSLLLLAQNYLREHRSLLALPCAAYLNSKTTGIDELILLKYAKTLIHSRFKQEFAEQLPKYFRSLFRAHDIRTSETLEIMRMLLLMGADINKLDCYLNIKPMIKYSPLITAIQKVAPETVSFLIDHGADLTIPDETNKTAYQYAQEFLNLDLTNIQAQEISALVQKHKLV